jgi:predicted nucleotidyltransferase
MDQNICTAAPLDRFCEQLVVWAAGRGDIEAVYLCGSAAAGRANELSDVDVAVLARRDLDAKRLWRLEDHWTGLFPKLPRGEGQISEPAFSRFPPTPAGRAGDRLSSRESPTFAHR